MVIDKMINFWWLTCSIGFRHLCHSYGSDKRRADLRKACHLGRDLTMVIRISALAQPNPFLEALQGKVVTTRSHDENIEKIIITTTCGHNFSLKCFHKMDWVRQVHLCELL